MKYPKELSKLIHFLKKFPGVGTRTAERFAFHLFQWPKEQLEELGHQLIEFKKNLTQCADCGTLISEGKCFFCTTCTRDPSLLCVVSSPKDVFAIEETAAYRGIYHVLPNLLSPLDQRHLEKFDIDALQRRIEKTAVREVILALDATLEGDATALFIKKHCEKWNVNVTRLAFGLPIGSSLEYVDGGTLTQAFTGRQSF